MSTRRQNLRNLVTALALGLTAGYPGLAPATDAEIYLGSDALRPGARPNVLFIFDTSESMTKNDVGQVGSRLERMKTAVDLVLDSVNNVNAGLMRFTEPGGSVLYPVAYLESGANDQPDVNVRITDSADDAEEHKATGLVRLDSPIMELVHTPVSGPETTISMLPILKGVDDAEQAENSVFTFAPCPPPLSPFLLCPTFVFPVDLSSPLMEATDNRLVPYSNRFNGLIFRTSTVASPIPAGSRISSSFIEFRSNSPRSGPVTLTFRGEKDSTPAPYSAGNGPRDRLMKPGGMTAASVAWTPPPLTPDEFYRTPDISSITQELVGPGSGWGPGSDLGFVFTGTPAADDEARRDFTTFEATTPASGAQAARFSVTYGAGPAVGSPDVEQIVGLRFPDVRVPQGMRIINAVIEFTPAAQSSGANTVNVRGELAVDSPPFTTTTSDLSRRTKTAPIPWDIPAWPTVDVSQQTPNLQLIVEEIVRNNAWCGGNAMTFFIEKNSAGADPRKAFSWDGDPQKAPVLRIDFDETSPLGPTQGCTVVELQRQVAASADDAFELDLNGSMFLTGTVLSAQPGRSIGLRFNDIALLKDTEVLDARLFVTASADRTRVTTTTIRGQLSADAGAFTTSLNDISARAQTSAAGTWTLPDMVINQEVGSPNIAPVIGEVLTTTGWKPGSDLVLGMFTSAGERSIHTFDRDAARAPRLYIKAKVFLGKTGQPSLTVRQRLKDLVAELPANNFTPLVDTLYEAGLYFRGNAVDYGLTRGNKVDSIKARNRISHKRSFINGAIEPAESICSPGNLNSPTCVDQRIVPLGTGTPTYISPISETCQANFIVLLTDGTATVNNSHVKIQQMTGKTSCSTTLLDKTTAATLEEQCGLELAEFLATKDQVASTPDDVETVKTYTIGFNIDSNWLIDLAKAGGGDHYKANSAAELAATLRDIISAILSRTTSFAQPSLSVNAFNRLLHRSEVYFSLFAPSDRVRWDGNVKKYQLCQNTADGCIVGEVLDYQEPNPGTPIGKRRGNPAIGTGQRISSGARSDWLPVSAPADGAAVLVGGAGRVLQEDVGYSQRRVFTYVGGTLPALLTTGSAHEITATNITDVRLLGGSPVATDPDFMPEAERLALIDWIRGRDVDNILNPTGTRYPMNDPLHSSPVAITFGGTNAVPVIKVFVGTNDGSVRMLNAYTGAEEWSFIPPSLLRNQRDLRENARAEHIYGMDGTPTLWVSDENGDGIIDPAVDINGDGVGEFVRLFIGMRRGGAEIIALEVTPSLELTDPVADTIDPKLLWIIAGNPDGSSLVPLEYGRLGDTWSRPRITTLRSGVLDPITGTYDSRATPALIFAGGYDNGAQDGPTGLVAGGVGNAIYVADPATGARLAYATATADLTAHTGSGGIGVSGMDYPIPSDVALLDSDGDGSTDRLYVGDTGGKLWRVDFDANITSGGVKLVVGQLASVSTLPPGKKNSRKFFYPPDVVQVRDRKSHSATGNYDLVTIVSGNRSHPLDLDVQNRFYAIYDETTGRMIDSNSLGTEDGIANGYPVARDGGGTSTTGTPIAGPTDDDPPTVAASGDLLRINDRVVFDPTTTAGAANLADLRSRSGYYLDLGPPNIPGQDPPSNSGEKGLASPIILAGKVFFTTYLPRAVLQSSACSLSEGGGQLYGLDVLTGAPAYNYDKSSDPNNLTANDRVYKLGGGIPSAAVPIFQEAAITLLIGGGGGATTINPGVSLPRERTYWIEE